MNRESTRYRPRGFGNSFPDFPEGVGLRWRELPCLSSISSKLAQILYSRPPVPIIRVWQATTKNQIVIIGF